MGMRGGFRNRDRDIHVSQKEIDDAFGRFVETGIDALNDIDWDANEIDDHANDTWDINGKLYDANGNPIDPTTLRRESTPYKPEQSTGKITSNVEKKAWIDRINAMSPHERAVAITAFSDEELINELLGRLKTSRMYIKKMRDILGDDES